jgi:molybdopterin molybdotransferase
MANPTAANIDVRMRGFAGRTLVEEATAWVDQHSRALTAERAALDQLRGRILTADIRSGMNVPPFDRAAMDGYALRGGESVGAGPYNPLSFRLCGQALPSLPYEGTVLPGTAVRIMTGAPMPEGADAVVPAEYAEASAEAVQITAPIAPGKHVGRLGEDVTEGSVVLAAGRRLRPQDVGLLASIGIDAANVIRRPRVAILATGDELVSPGKPKGMHQIYDANSSMLAGLSERDGAVVTEWLHLEDSRERIRQAMQQSEADVLLISGGSSVGSEDHAPTLLAELGELAVHGVAMRPSSPVGFGRIGERLVFLLPGNPVSCLCAYDFFAGRAIRRLGARNADWPYPVSEQTLSRKIVSAVGRVDYCRVRRVDNGVEPLALSGASILSSTSRADGFIIIPAASEGYAPGQRVTVYHYDSSH